MFERFTEKARRVIFFARFEASHYGSLAIDTEHILLGLLREDIALMHRYAGPVESATEIRTELERVIKQHAPIPTNVEVPLSADSKMILNFAGEEADRLCDRHIDTEHILLGIFRVPNSVAAKLLLARGCEAQCDPRPNGKRLRVGCRDYASGHRRARHARRVFNSAESRNFQPTRRLL